MEWVQSIFILKPSYYLITPYVKIAAKAAKCIFLLPFSFLAYEYYKNKDVRGTTTESMECFAWPAGIFVVKHFRPNPF